MKTIGLLGGMSWESTELYLEELLSAIDRIAGIVLISWRRALWGWY